MRRVVGQVAWGAGAALTVAPRRAAAHAINAESVRGLGFGASEVGRHAPRPSPGHAWDPGGDGIRGNEGRSGSTISDVIPEAEGALAVGFCHAFAALGDPRAVVVNLACDFVLGIAASVLQYPGASLPIGGGVSDRAV